MNTPSFGGSQKPGTETTLKGRLIAGVLLAFVIGLLVVGGIKINQSRKAASLAGSASTGSSSGSSSPGIFDRLFAAKPDVTVCVVTWGGYVGGQYFNNGFKASKDSRYYKQYGMTVEFKVIDDFGPSRDAWKGDQCQAIWTTADSEVTEVMGLYNEHHPKTIFQSDWSRGGDVAVGNNEIKSVKDLRGKKVAYLPDSPSHTLLLNMLEANGMTMDDIISVQTPGAPQAAEAFKAGNVDAAIVWSPDDQDILTKVPGSHVLMSSRQASNIIADVFYVKESFIEAHTDLLTHLLEGWFIGAAEINSDPAAKDRAADILVEGFQGAVDKAFALGAINNARLTTYGDNLNFFGLNPAYKGVRGEDLYSKMTRMYTVAGRISGTPPAWRSIVDTRILQGVKLTATGIHAAENSFTFGTPTAELASAPAVTSKGLTVTYATGSSTLDQNAQTIIDLGFAHTAKVFGAERVRIEGNTDNTGDPEQNRKLSERRARSVANYLVSRYGFDRNRFVVVGHGQDNPVCNEDTVECRTKNRRTDFQLLNQ